MTKHRPLFAKRVSNQTFTDLIKDLIPADKPFTITEMMDWLREAHPGRRVCDDTSIATKSLAEVTELILHEAGKPLRLIDVAIGMRERGYRSDHLPHTVCTAVRLMFKRCPGRFVKGEDGKWGMAGWVLEI